jgi:hypothetical protein
MPIEVSQTQFSSLIILFVLLISIIVAVYFAIKSGDKYSVEDTEREAVSFAGIVSEGEGPITTFLVIAFIVLIAWGVVYLVLYI